MNSNSRSNNEKSMRAKLADLNEAINVFRSEGPVVVTESKIESYLVATASNELDAGTRLVVLANSLQGDDFADGWKGFCQIYEYAQRHESNDSGIVVTWLISALECWLQESHTPDLGERLTVVADSEALLMRDLEQNGNSSGVAYMLGLLHFRHPIKSAENFKKAFDWFQDSISWIAYPDEDSALAQLHMGHCLVELGDIPAALEQYEKIDERSLQEMNDEDSILMLHEQIAKCKGESPT